MTMLLPTTRLSWSPWAASFKATAYAPDEILTVPRDKRDLHTVNGPAFSLPCRMGRYHNMITPGV